MTTTTQFSRKKLRAGSALQALALLGAGLTISAAMATPAAAQDFQNVTASGRVQGTSGQAIAGATVTITSQAQGFTRTTTTSGDGSYRVPQLPSGLYTFTVSADGFQTYSEPGIALNSTGAANQFTLAPANAEVAGGEIIVTAGRIETVDFNQTTTGASINVSDLANRIPVGRDLTSIIELSPGTASGDTAFGNLPSIAGSSVAENVYYVNGLNITNFRTFLGSNSVPFEFYDTVDIKNGGYPAEFGRSTGGAVIATTKSGSNEYHAGAIVTWEPNGLRSTSPNTRSADNDADFSEDLRADFYVSGPIIKDHLFFYGLYEARDVKTGAGGLTSGSYTIGRTKSPFFAGKVDAVITDGQRLEFTYFRTKGKQRNDTYAYDPDTNELGDYVQTGISEYGGDNYVGRYTGSFTDWLTVSAAYGKSKDRDNALTTTPDLPLVIDYRTNSAGDSLAAQTYFLEDHIDEREFYRGDIDIFVNLFGAHHFRGGYERENLLTTGGTHYSSGSYYQIFTSDPDEDTGLTICGTTTPCDYVSRRTFENGGGFTSKNEAFYIQDQWSLFQNRVTLNLGIRNDRFKNYNADGVPFYESGDQWGPRLGFTVDPFGNQRTKIYGSFGRYFLPIAANTNIRSAGREYDVRDYYELGGINSNGTVILGSPIAGIGACPLNDETNCDVVRDGSVSGTDTTIGQGLKPQSMDEYIIGAEQRFGEYWRLGAYFTYRTLNRALEDVAIDQGVLAYCEANGIVMRNDPDGIAGNGDENGCADLYTGTSQYVLVNPGYDSRVLLNSVFAGDTEARTIDLVAADLGYPFARRKFYGMTFKVDRDFDGVWSLSGSYTFSKTIGNYEGAVKSDIGQADPGATQDFDIPGLIPGTYGYSPNDHRHNIKLYGSYKVSDWLQVGANFQALSPRHFGCIGTVPLSKDPFAYLYGASGNYCRFKDGQVSQDNPTVLVQRGTAFKSDWQTSLDLTAAFTLPTDMFEGVLRFDVFNVFNSKAALDFDEFGSLDPLNAGGDQTATPDTYRNILGYQAPRSARIQLQLRF